MKLKVRNFGPIKDGFTHSKDGFFEVGKLSIFVGNQGAGKSTIAKLISSLLWVEKVIFSSEMNKNDISGCDFIALSSSIAIFLGNNLDINTLNILASFFSSLGDNLGIIAASKSE